MTTKVNFITIIGKSFLTGIMQKADVFEQFKVIGEIQHMTITYQKEADYPLGEKLLGHVVRALKEHKGFFPVFVHLKSIENGDTILLNKSGKVPYWQDEKIKAVSDGKNWFTLHEFKRTLQIQ